MKKENILFVCRFNRFRSRVATAYFNKVNKNKKFKARGAGLFKGRPIDKFEQKIAKEFGINIKGTPQGLSTELLIWQDRIIIVADDVPKAVFYSKKYKNKVIIWKLPDVFTNNKKKAGDLVKEIIKKVDDLIIKLEKKIK